MDNNISFSGGFLLKKPSQIMWKKIYTEAVPEKRVIIDDLYEKGNVFFASGSSYDANILKYLLSKKNLKFTYYPEVDLKKQMISQRPRKAQKFLNSQPVIESKSEMKKIIAPKLDLKYSRKHGDYIAQTFDALKLNPEEYSTKTKRFITKIYDKNKNVIAKISPNNNSGINYAIIYPRYSDEKLTMAAINHRGEILTKSTNLDLIKDFNKQFLAAVKTEAERIKPVSKS